MKNIKQTLTHSQGSSKNVWIKLTERNAKDFNNMIYAHIFCSEKTDVLIY